MQFLFPFEKNRYFPHKRMRSADFSRELAYMDHKFQFLGRWIFGTGPACGLEVQRLDSDSLLISPGMAVDDLGRCIIVDEPAICRIRTLPGFDDLNGETALLWLSYREELKDPVTVAGEQEEQQEYTVCAERYTFALSDMSFLPPDAVDASLYSRSMIFEDETLHIEQVIPRVLSAQHPSKIRLILQNFSLDTITVRILYQPELPGFCMENGEKRLCWEQCVKVPCGFISIDLTVVPDTTARSAPFTLSSDGLTVQIQGRKRYAKSSFYEELKLTQRDPLEVLSAQLSSLSLQQLYGDEECRGIPIAGIRFLRYGSRKKAIFCGILYEVHWDEPLSQGPLGLEAVFLDVRGQLMHSACADAGSTRTLSQMIETILEQDCCKKLAASREIDKLPTDWDLPVQRSGLSDYEQLCRAASFLCYEFYAYADTLYFGPPRPVSSPVLTFSDTTGLIQLRRRNTLEHQCAAVAVSGADDQGKRIYVRHARSREHGFGCKQIRSALTNDLHQPEPTVRTMSQAQYLAKARMEQRQRQTAGLIGICLGAPELRPGRFIKVSGFSQAVNGTYYVYTVRHTLDAGGYKTDWEAEE